MNKCWKWKKEDKELKTRRHKVKEEEKGTKEE